MTPHTNATISYKQFASQLWQARLYIVSCTTIAIILAGLILASLSQKTRIQMLIAPASNLSSDNVITNKVNNAILLKALSQATGNQTGDHFNHFLATISSIQTAQQLLKASQIMDGLKQDKSLPFASNNTQWSAARLSAYIKDKVRIKMHGTTAMKELEYWHPSPDFGQYFLQAIHSVSDQKIRKKTASLAQKRIKHLSQKIEKTQQIQHKNILQQLLLEQERILMLSAIDSHFAAQIIAAPSPFYKSEWPPYILIIALFIIFGCATGYTISIIKNNHDE